jgi:hypothetical protein
VKKLTIAFVGVLAGGLGTSLLPLPAEAGGLVRVYNETSQTIHPWYKCPAPACPTTGWTFFGAIGGPGEFEWDFSSFPGDWAFTYTLDGQPAPVDPVQGDQKTLFTVDSITNNVIQIGNKIRSVDLNAPNENGKSAKWRLDRA